MRLFIALPLPEIVQHYLAELQRSIGSDASKFSLVKNFHLTLKFLGEVSEAQLEHIHVALHGIQHDSFSFTIGTISFFPRNTSVSVIWVGVQQEQPILELQSKVDAALVKYFPKEKQFKAHITLARVKSLQDRDAFIKRAEANAVNPLEIPADKFTLMKSTLLKSGVLHEPLYEYLLQ